MVLTVCSMLLAAGIEFARKANIHENGYFQQEVAGKFFNASDLSIFAQVPQYTFMGASEVFTIITGKRPSALYLILYLLNMAVHVL